MEENENRETHVAPEANTSIVLAFVNHDKEAIRRAEAITMTAMRSAVLTSAFMRAMGTKRKRTTSQAISDRVSFCDRDAGNIDMLGLRDMSL